MSGRAKAFWFQLVPLYVIGMVLVTLVSSDVVSITVGVILGLASAAWQEAYR